MEMDKLNAAFEAEFAYQRAIDAAWRKIARSQEEWVALGPTIDGVMARIGASDAATRAGVRRELERRLRNCRAASTASAGA